jgi:RNA polymerase sigma-70 factor (ECF subfamily)
MAIFRRSHASLGGSRPDAVGEACPGSSVDAVNALTGVAVSTAPAGAIKAAELLPDVQVAERERHREQRLVEAACRGEESAIEALYRTHFDAIYRYVLLRVGSPSAAEDVTSQVFLGMLRGLGRYRDEGKPFVAWLYGIAQKQIAFFMRGQSRVPGAVDLDAAAELVGHSAGPHATAEQREARVAIAQALSKVPDGQREVIMLRYILSLSVAETASVVGRTEGAVKQLQLRGLATLKAILGHEGLDLI